MGQPQYLCLEIPQSRILKLIFDLPNPFSTNASIILVLAMDDSRLSNSSEFIKMPSPEYTLLLVLLSIEVITTFIGSLYLIANS